MNSKLKNDSTDYLFKAILSLENEEDCYRFFEDLCTSAELKAMSQRLVVAKMLTEKSIRQNISYMILRSKNCLNLESKSCHLRKNCKSRSRNLRMN